MSSTEENIINKKTILVSSTCINRSELHKQILPSWYDFINVLDRKYYDIHWFINVDYIEKLNEDVETTKESLKNIIKDIPITFIEKESNDGHFFNACRNLAISIENKVIEEKLAQDDVIVFWLEDDWKLEDDVIPLQELIEIYLSNLTYINLNCLKQNYIHALAPSIINYNLWSKIQLAAWKQKFTRYIDPEHCSGLYFIKNNCKFDKIRNITVIQDKYRMKEIDNIYKYLTGKVFVDYNNSYYTYYNETTMINNERNDDKYIEKSNVKDFNNDTIVFLRIIPFYCKDGGREYMQEKFGLVKNKNNVNFYKEK